MVSLSLFRCLVCCPTFLFERTFANGVDFVYIVFLLPLPLSAASQLFRARRFSAVPGAPLAGFCSRVRPPPRRPPSLLLARRSLYAVSRLFSPLFLPHGIYNHLALSSAFIRCVPISRTSLCVCSPADLLCGCFHRSPSWVPDANTCSLGHVHPL